MNYSNWLDNAVAFYRSGATRPEAFRLDQLERLDNALREREDSLLKALHADLGKPAVEAYASEIGFVLSDIDYTRRHLRKWMRRKRRPAPLMTWPAKAYVYPEPRGVILIIGPWNYPVQLLLSPLVAAIAAGNCAALKSSELAPHTAGVLGELIKDTFEPEHVGFFEGDADTAQGLLALPFDHIFFTGSSSIGRKVMAAAAKNLSSVTLELGGRNPCIVCGDADVHLTARRIAWGKFLNAGQTCVAPNHVLVQRDIYRPLLEELRACIQRFYGDQPQKSPDYGRIISEKHFIRLVHLLEGVKVHSGGQHDATDRFIAPTVVTDPPDGHAVMAEEIFGPILPVIPYDDLDTGLQQLAAQSTPLALYVFTENRKQYEHIMQRVPSGGAGINDTINQIIGKALPFGGLGESGMGAYHGKAGFDTFCHYRSLLVRSSKLDPGLAYPPTKTPLEKLKKFYGLMTRH